jgi:hypothetical protein
MVRVFLQYTDAPRLRVLADSSRIEIVGEWDTDWKLKKKDVERFYIEKKQDKLLVWAKAHYGIQFTKHKVNSNDITLLFDGDSHAPVGIWDGHNPRPDGYGENVFIFKFYDDKVMKMYFGKLRPNSF